MHLFGTLVWIGSAVAMLGAATGWARTEALDANRLFSIRFSSQSSESGAGFVVGSVRNKSGRDFSCIVLEFNLFTRFDRRQAGEPNRNLGILPVEVRNLRSGTVAKFRQALPQPAGFGLGQVRRCAQDVAMPPRIVAFQPTIRRVGRSHEVAFHWRVENAATIRLFDDHGELEGDWSAAETGAQSIGYSGPTTYRLVAIGSDGRRVEKRFRVALASADHPKSRVVVRPPLSGLQVCGRIDDPPNQPLLCRAEGTVFGRDANLLLHFDRIARGEHKVSITIFHCAAFGSSDCRKKGAVERRFQAPRTGPLDVSLTTGTHVGIGVFRAKVRVDDRASMSTVDYCIQSSCR